MILTSLAATCEETSVELPVFVVPLVLVAAVVGILLVAKWNRRTAKVLAVVLGVLIAVNVLMEVGSHFVPCD